MRNVVFYCFYHTESLCAHYIQIGLCRIPHRFIMGARYSVHSYCICLIVYSFIWGNIMKYPTQDSNLGGRKTVLYIMAVFQKSLH